jgi:cytochrome P450
LIGAEIEGSKLPIEHIRGTMTLLMIAGIDTTWSAIGASLWHLARMELRVALEEWLDRYPDFELSDPSAVTWSGGQVRGPRTLPVTIPGEGR